MAPRRKSSGSSANTKKSCGSTQTNGRSSRTSVSKSPTKTGVTKPSTTGHRKKSVKRVAHADDLRLGSTANVRKASSAHGSRHTHFDRHVYPQNGAPEAIAGSSSSVIGNGDEPIEHAHVDSRPAVVQKPSNSRILKGEPPNNPHLSARPNKPSRKLEAPRPRNVAKPDPAKGASYAILDEERNITGDTRQKMAYLQHYDDLYTSLIQLQNYIQGLATAYFSYEVDVQEKSYWLENLGRNLSDEFVRYAGFIGVGGACAVAGWEEILLTPQLRAALAAGVIWLVLKQHVFSSLYFGAAEEQYELFRDLELQMTKEECGFLRNVKRVNEIVANGRGGIVENDRFPEASLGKEYLAASIYALLAPLLDVPNGQDDHLLATLVAGVHLAVKMHHCMRLDRDTIYSFAVTSKDSPYDSNFVRLFSERHLKWLSSDTNHASNTVAEPEKGLTEEKLDRVHKYALLSRIVVFEPLEAYRKGGWREEDRNKGYRRMLICKGAIACRWGATRKFSKGHSSEGSFVELRDAVNRLGRGKKWWDETPADPALAAENVPVLGTKGKGRQPEDLTGFQPRWFSTI